MTAQRHTPSPQPAAPERRHGRERRQHHAPPTVRFPSWSEQQVQFCTRYLFLGLALAFFNLSKGISPAWLTLLQMNGALLVYAGCVTALFIHASRTHFSPTRFRLAMLVDITIVAIAVVNDPYPLPPSELVFIVVVLGNGMRYGMRIFAEALIGSFAAIILAFFLRFSGHGQVLTPGLIFLNLFGGIILVYSYILMGRIEKNHTHLEQQSRRDPLTGVMNRRALFELAGPLFQQAENNQSPLTVMFADLDKFKAINDSFGHSRGDQVLRDFAAILQHAIRGYDLVARLGGDEFVLLLPDATLDQAEPTAHRIQQAVRDYAAAKHLNFSVSFGLGEAPRHGRTLVEILHQVDSALYQSKSLDRQDGIARVTDDTPAPTFGRARA